MEHTKYPFLDTLNFLYLMKLTNELVLQNPGWTPISTKLSLDIPKFEGNPKEYTENHVMTFHLWFSSNSLMDDSITLCLFQITLTWGSSEVVQ